MACDSGGGVKDDVDATDTAPPDTETGAADTGADTAAPPEEETGDTAVDTGSPPTATITLSDTLGAKLVGEPGGGYENGADVAAAGDVNDDGFADVLVGMAGVDAWAGAAYVVLGPVSGTVALSEADARLTGAPSTTEMAGASVAGAGDVDGDGYDDLLVGAPNYDGTGEYEGQAYLVRGPVSGGLALADADAILHGEAVTAYPCESYSETGDSVAAAGDLDGDGLADLLLGAWSNDCGAGSVFLLHGPVSGLVELGSAADAEIAGAPDVACCRGQHLASAGDVDGDGLDDVLVGWEDDVGDARALLFLSPMVGVHSTDAADARLIRGAVNDDVSGPAGLGDTDGDGHPDIAVGHATDQEGAYYGGAALVFRGPLAGDIDLDAPDAKGR